MVVLKASSAADVLAIAARLPVWETLDSGPTIKAKGHGVSLLSQQFTNPRNQETSDYDAVTKVSGFSILPITRDGKLVLAITSKPFAGRVIGLPAGLRRSEDVMADARNELKQEAGSESELILTSPNPIWYAPMKIAGSSFHTFVVLNFEVQHRQDLEIGEAEIVLVEVPVPVVMDMIRSGQINTAETIIAVFNAMHHGLLP